jgi:transcription-repair coupling factor (superfamily II helicase)
MQIEPEEVTGLRRAIESGARVISIDGLTSISAKSFVLSRLGISNPIVVVTDSNASLETWDCDLQFWTRGSDTRIVSLPSFETDVYSGSSPHAVTMERRALGLWALARSKPQFVVLSPRSLISRTVTAAEIESLGSELKLSQEYPLDELTATLVSAGYVREDPVGGVGQFSVRGGIVDVWPPDAQAPVRVEFFGDEVDSIRRFDPETQLSVEKLSTISLPPMREFAASSADMKDWAFFARERFEGDVYARGLLDRTEFAEEGETFSGWEFLIPLVKTLNATVFDYLKDAVFLIDEPASVEQTLAGLYDNLRRRYNSLAETGEIGLEPKELFLEVNDLRECLNEHRRVELRALGRSAAAVDEDFAFASGNQVNSDHIRANQSISSAGTAGSADPGDPLFLFPTAERAFEIEIQSRSTRKFHGDLARFFAEVGEMPDAKFVFDTLGIAERFEDLLSEHESNVVPESILIGPISSGFEIPHEGTVYFSETDIFGESSAGEGAATKPQPQRHKSRLGAFISDFRDLKPGDLVVHVDHGIGRFEALQTITAQGAEREFMLLVYADDAKLFVPVERLDLVSRYSSAETATAPLDRLGGLGWQRTKAKAKRAMRDMADELLRLYAERRLVQGYAFSADAPWQHEFEDAFPYDLTEDQAKAIEDVKADMETPRPMDRLIIGDVGYGKTEVAMRAAFKAVMDGRQVAVLSPTTILAYQHFESFRKRFAAFPAKIDLLSRFRSKTEQKSVAEMTKSGDVDVLIGTHRILSNDVSLPKLGLLVVDEEQRFGVAHKEKLKQLKKKVDVLTLSATPIPRTLNMSLIGMRDMSVIETPPRDRLAINTQVVQFSESVIRSAIELELARNGQVFFIHNRVESIEPIAALLQKIVPNARIAIGHGQMNEKEMEQVMLDFIDYKYDILVATTIIENGIDIPRANTIIINRADNYGLSQLYQLRGRVGRSNRRAYAYLLIPSELELTPIARRRLSAIREFSDLGAGFRLAALDLELRGAGNILGGEQSGHLDALGFDLYTKMLERTIAEMRGDEIADEINVSINLGVDVSIPKEYIVEASQRLRTYKRIASSESEESLAKIRSEIEDRYGRIPGSVENLFLYGKLRKRAERAGIVSIDKAGADIAIKFAESTKVSPESLMQILNENSNASFSPNGILRFPAGDGNPLQNAIRVVESIS